MCQGIVKGVRYVAPPPTFYIPRLLTARGKAFKTSLETQDVLHTSDHYGGECWELNISSLYSVLKFKRMQIANMVY